MAATKRNLLSGLRSGRPHYGFGQEPVPSKSTKPKNWPLARFVNRYNRLPEEGELEAFMEEEKEPDD